MVIDSWCATLVLIGKKLYRVIHGDNQTTTQDTHTSLAFQRESIDIWSAYSHTESAYAKPSLTDWVVLLHQSA